MKNEREMIQFCGDLVQKEIDTGNIKMMQKIREMLDGDFELEDAPGWWRDQPSSEPFDGWRDAVDLFSPLIPKLKMTPYSGEAEDRQKADRIEQALMWQAKRTMNRAGDPHKAMVEDAFAYGRVAAQLVYLPYWKDSMKVFGGNEKRQKLAMRNGDYVVIRKDPRTVFPHHSDYMLEGVLSATLKTVKEVIDFWGPELAKPLVERVSRNENFQWCIEYDYWDLDQRAVFVNMAETNMIDPYTVTGTMLFNEKNELPFLPWVISDLGNPLQPLLYPIYKFDYWKSMCIMESALISQVIGLINYPRAYVKNGKVHIDTNDLGNVAEIEGPLAEFGPMPPIGLDPALNEAIMQMKGRVGKSTISHSVQTGDFGSGAAYASIRELIDLQTRKLNNGKRILEKQWTELFKQMLYWIDYTGNTLTGYGERLEGKQIRVIPGEKIETEKDISFDVNNLFFEVEMMPDVPEDMVQRQNAGNMHKQLGGSTKTALEIVGITDTEKEIQERRREELEEAQHQANIELMNARRMREFEMETEVMKAQMAQAMQAQQQPQPGPGMGGGIPQAIPMPGMQPGMEPGTGPESAMLSPEMLRQAPASGAGFENMGGPGFDPAMGGSPPILGDQTGTRETQNKRNRGG